VAPVGAITFTADELPELEDPDPPLDELEDDCDELLDEPEEDAASELLEFEAGFTWVALQPSRQMHRHRGIRFFMRRTPSKR
jgi:hypothetical protein